MGQLSRGTVVEDGSRRYRLENYIGAGSYGEVWQAVDESDGSQVAIKLYIMLDQKGREEFMSEYEIAYGLSHKNLLTPSYIGTWENRPFLVMRYCAKGSCAGLVGKLEPGPESEQVIWRFIHDVAAGLAFLHAVEPDPIVHQDIKPDNILMDADGSFVITDFGISKKIRSTMRSQSSRAVQAGAIAYMGPERFSANPSPIKASDIWSLGASIYELAMGELPFFGQGGNMLRNGADLPELDNRWSYDLGYVVSACLAKDPWDRLQASQLERFAAVKLNIDEPVAPADDPHKTRRYVVAGEEPVNQKEPAGGEEPSGQSGAEVPTRKKLNKNAMMIGAAVAALVIFLVIFAAGSGKRAAKNKFDDYSALVSRCRENINNGSSSEYTLLIDARQMADKIKSYEDSYAKYRPDLYDNYRYLNDALNAQLSKASEAWSKAAQSQSSIGESQKAEEFYSLAHKLEENIKP